MNLSQLKPTQMGLIEEVQGTGALRHHLLDMGFLPDTPVIVQKRAPMGDPLQIRLRGYEITLRKEEAEKLLVRKVDGLPPSKRPQSDEHYVPIDHPKVGEEGFRAQDPNRHDKAKFDRNAPLRIALAGNQNSGKTTLFNQLTGSNQHVGNFPGVTVDRKDGQLRRYPNVTITDLPGIYSLSPYSSEELVTRRFLLEEKPEAIINIVDASNLERNLNLTLQLMELRIPMVLAVNMMDELTANKGSLRVNLMEKLLGIPVVPISAVKNQGVDELVEHLLHVARFQEAPHALRFLPSLAPLPWQENLDRTRKALAQLIQPNAEKLGLPLHFCSGKLIEKDHVVEESLRLSNEKKDAIQSLLLLMEKEIHRDGELAISQHRFALIEEICRQCLILPRESKEHARSMAIDKILTGRFTGIPAFLLIMGLIFFITFGWIGTGLQDGMEVLVARGTEALSALLTRLAVNPVLHSLVIDGIASGVGSVISFLPVIVTLFLCLSLLEDSGYMARVAFIMDRPLRKIGLSGRSFVPMLIGFGCSVPAIMATRTLSSERDRRMTILLTPFMSCSAKLPIYGLIVGAFFPAGLQVPIMIFLYAFGIFCGILYSLLLKKTRYRGEPVPFVMELPNYRLPGLRSVLQLIWEKAKGFLQKAFTIIFAASIVIWFLQSFDLHFNLVENPEDSLLADLGALVSPIFQPLGFGDWRVSTALITGFTAKEAVVSTLTQLLGGDLSLLPRLFTPYTAFTFLIFTLLYTPCVAAIATVRRELGSRLGALETVMVQCGIAWIISYLFHLLGLLLGMI